MSGDVLTMEGTVLNVHRGDLHEIELLDRGTLRRTVLATWERVA